MSGTLSEHSISKESKESRESKERKKSKESKDSTESKESTERPHLVGHVIRAFDFTFVHLARHVRCV